MSRIIKPYDYQTGLVKRDDGEKINQGHALGGRLFWVIIPLLLAAAIVAAIALRPHTPNSLGDSYLAGSRPPTSINFVFLRDDSGSFAGFEQMRNDAIAQVLAWAPNNLRNDDTITVISFASAALVTMPTTLVGDLANNHISPSRGTAKDGRYTNLIPALKSAIDTLPSNKTPTSIIAITDTLIADTQSPEIIELLSELNVTSMSVILPKGMDLNDSWASTFAWEAEFRSDPDDTQAIAIAVGQALAHATGQRLKANT